MKNLLWLCKFRRRLSEEDPDLYARSLIHVLNLADGLGLLPKEQ
jgi:hypothetical protein